MKSTCLSTPDFRDDSGRQGETLRVTACTCSYESSDWPGGDRVANLKCPIHGLQDAAEEALGRILGGT